MATFRQYFPEDVTTNYWVKNPLSVKNVPEDVEEKELFIGMTSDSSMKHLFEKKRTLESFWMVTKSEYPGLHKQAIKSNTFCVKLPL